MVAPSSPAPLSDAERLELLALLEERERRRRRRKLWTYYPETGPYRRALYPKHLAFFAAGARHRERLMLAANRIGKTEGVGGYETTLHLTGLYPAWWEGQRFVRPVRAWMAGKTNETTRDILQMKMFGETIYVFGRRSVAGTGLIPGEAIGAIAWKQGVTGLVDHARIRHVSGGWSVLGVKSYQQGRRSFEGTEQDIVWLDEEPPLDIYTECVVRTMTTDGLILLTFTPLEGMSEVVLSFLPGGRIQEDERGEGLPS